MISTKNVNLGFVGEVSGYKGDMKALIRCMDTDNVTPVDNVKLMDTHTTERIDNDIYLIYTKNGTSKIYKQLPLVYNDDVFRWTERKPHCKGQYKMLLASVDRGILRFCCTAYPETGEGVIKVYCTLRGRNPGLIDGIRIDDVAADNEAFLDGINRYIDYFINRVMYCYDIPKGSNYKK